MSCNRENIIWKSPDGTWNRAFYDFSAANDLSDPEFDYEWDVDYDFTKFWWASTSHATQEEALASWDGSNPYGYTLVVESSDETDKLDKMVQELRQ